MPPNIAADFLQDKLKELAARANEGNIQWDTPHPDQVNWDGPSTKDKAPSWGAALSSAPGAAVDEIGSAVSGIGKFIGSLPSDPLGYKIGRALMAAPGAIGHELGGMAQYVRNLSQPEFRGVAPEMAGGEPENHPWLAAAASDSAPMRQAIATHPLGTLADVAAVAGTTAPGRWLLGKGADLGMAVPRAIKRGVQDALPGTRAENRLLAAASHEADPATIAALLDSNKAPVPDLNYSAAQATQAPGMSALELQSRNSPVAAPSWANFDTRQNSAVFRALNNIVDPATDTAVQAARDVRDKATKYKREAALALANQGGLEGQLGLGEAEAPTLRAEREGLNSHVDEIRDAVHSELNGARAVVPGVPRMTDYVMRNIGTTSEPAGATYEVRKVLADALNRKAGINLSELESSVKSADVSSRAIKSSIDSALNEASGGMFQQYLDAFKAASPNVNNVEALNAIRADLAKKVEGGAVDLNGNPKLSRAYLKQIFERHSTNKYGDTLLPGTKSQLGDILETTQQMEAPSLNYKGAVTGGGGSMTKHNFALDGARHLADMLGLGPVARGASAVARGVSSIGESASSQRLAALLQEQESAAQAIRSAAAREAARKAKKSSGITPAALAAILAAQPQN